MVNSIRRHITNHDDGTITHRRMIQWFTQTRIYTSPPLSESWELSTFVADESASKYKLRKGIYLFCMSVPNKSVEQRKDLFTAYCFKIFAIGILNADIMLHTDLSILNRRLSYRGLSKITKKTYLNIQQHVTISESSGPSIQSILSDPALDIFSTTQHQHPSLQKFLLDVAMYLKKL